MKGFALRASPQAAKKKRAAHGGSFALRAPPQAVKKEAGRLWRPAEL